MSANVASARGRPASRSRSWLPNRQLGIYFLRRLGQGLLVIALVALTVFVATRVISDPARKMLPLDATSAQVDQLRHTLGLDQSIPGQFVDYIRAIATFDFGQSYWQKTSVSGLIGEFLPHTLVLVAVAMVFAIVFGILLGIVASMRPGSWLDQFCASLSLIGLSLPQFWLGAMLIYFFAVRLGWLPTSGMGGVKNIILPAVTLGVPSLGRIAQITRTITQGSGEMPAMGATLKAGEIG